MKLIARWLVFGWLCCLPLIGVAESAQMSAITTVQQLPLAARYTLQLIKQGGPFPYAKDGVVFGNYEGHLPRRKRNYYHEYTVQIVGARGRGAQRIVVGGDPHISGEYYYTKDHYASFLRIQE